MPENATEHVPADASPTESIAMVCVSRGFSGSDIAAVCRGAVSSMMKRTNPDLAAYARQSLAAIEQYGLETEPLTPRDVRTALGKTAPSLTQSSVENYERWDRQHGSG